MMNGSIFVMFLPHRHELVHEVNITTFDNKSNQLIFLERKTRMKYVGVLIDNSLSSAVAEGNKKSAEEGVVEIKLKILFLSAHNFPFIRSPHKIWAT